jgi:hypothetical protein
MQSKFEIIKFDVSSTILKMTNSSYTMDIVI